MKYLSTLTPAEVLLLRHGSGVSYKDLLKATFMDLLIRKILKIIKKRYEESEIRNQVILSYVGKGPSFSMAKVLPHEMVFLETYAKTREMNPLFHHAVKIGYRNSGGKRAYIRTVFEKATIEKYVTPFFLYSLFGHFIINEAGQSVVSHINKELEELERTLPGLIVNDKRKAIEIIRKIKGNVFFVPNINHKLLAEVDIELLAEINKGNENTKKKRPEEDSTGCDTSCGSWGDIDLHAFDSGCGSSDSGCSSNGCGSSCGSSCGSGCGGGCGGD